ncbi:hypothetical protein HY485_01190 [Candidatus Woesearchaeota archaeon]|nr:hypothetical protein [Candidatus Woesearchaeota archaeon]
MKTTINGPYPRIGSELTQKLREETGAEETHPTILQHLQNDVTKELVRELVTAGIDLPNDGLVYANDELSWPLENTDGITFGGMHKTLHTNIIHRHIICTGEIKQKHFINPLHTTAVTEHSVKLELPGPYTLACHTEIGKTAPYKNIEEIAHAYAEFYRGVLLSRKKEDFVQFNEPSIIAYKREHPNLEMLPELYQNMLHKTKAQTAIWTSSGHYTRQTIDLLFSLPVDTIGIDFVWDQNVETLLKKISTDKNIGFGIVDSGDTGWCGQDDKNSIVKTLRSFAGYTYLSKALVAPNATLEHLPRNYAQQKIKLLRQIADEVNK